MLETCKQILWQVLKSFKEKSRNMAIKSRNLTIKRRSFNGFLPPPDKSA